MDWQFLKTRPKALAPLLVVLAGVSCTSSHNVRPLPDFVQTAIEPGDSVVVTTKSGETVEMVVTEVTRDAIHSADREVPLSRIDELQKIARKKPPSPCGGSEPLGCSVPLLVSMASDEHAHYRETFYSACEQHDYCYRHGNRTYGLEREYCDDEFLRNMQNTCPATRQSTLGSIFEAMNDSVDSRNTCMMIARDFHLAASDFGEKHYQSQSSTYCEYNGPP
jgi:hypothetical protein